MTTDTSGGRSTSAAPTSSASEAPRQSATKAVPVTKAVPTKAAKAAKTTPTKATPAKTTPAKRAAAAKKATPAKTTPAKKSAAAPVRGGAMVARDSNPPSDSADAADRLYTRAVHSDDALRRQIAWEIHHEVDLERKRLLIVFGYVIIGVVGVAALLALYLAGVIVLVDHVPGISPRQAATIVGSALVLATGGAAGSAAIGRFTGRRGHPRQEAADPRRGVGWLRRR